MASTTTKPPSSSSSGASSLQRKKSWQETLDGLPEGAEFIDHDFPADNSSLYDPGFPIKDKDGKVTGDWIVLALFVWSGGFQ